MFDRLRSLYLGGHHSLSFGDQRTFGAQALSITTFPLVTPQPRDETMISATGALRSSLFTVRSLVVLVVLRPVLAPAAKHDDVPRESNFVFFSYLRSFIYTHRISHTNVLESYKEKYLPDYFSFTYIRDF